MLTQHARIRGLVMELGDEVNGGHVRPETLWNIGERLEEREAFTITEIASRLATEEAGPHAEPWVLTEGLSYDPWPRAGDSEGGVLRRVGASSGSGAGDEKPKRLEGTTRRAQGVPEKEFVGREVDGDRLGLRAFPRWYRRTL